MASIDILKNLGADAFNNLYDVEIPQIPGVAGTEELKYRMQNFPVPTTPTPNKYIVRYKTQSIEKLGAMFENVFEVQLEIRIDRQMAVYNFFKNWMQLGINNTTGVIDEELIPKAPIVVRSTDTGDQGTGFLLTLQNSYPISLEGFTFSQDNGDPMIRTVTLHFDLPDFTQS